MQRAEFKDLYKFKRLMTFDLGAGVPAGEKIFYSCRVCTDVFPSRPVENEVCRCRNLSVDIEGRLGISKGNNSWAVLQVTGDRCVRKGYLYLMQHPDNPGLVKIGRTTRPPQQRLAEHNERGITGEIARATGKPWELVHYVPVTDASKAEAYLWEYFGGKGGGGYIDSYFRRKGGGAYDHGKVAGKIELLPSSVERVLDGLMNCAFLDKERYEAMLSVELRDYDVSKLLESIQAEREAKRADEKRPRTAKAAETRRRNRARKDLQESGS